MTTVQASVLGTKPLKGFYPTSTGWLFLPKGSSGHPVPVKNAPDDHRMTDDPVIRSSSGHCPVIVRNQNPRAHPRRLEEIILAHFQLRLWKPMRFLPRNAGKC